jgi:hypothetical protein
LKHDMIQLSYIVAYHAHQTSPQCF